jgi:hypothetical protein
MMPSMKTPRRSIAALGASLALLLLTATAAEAHRWHPLVVRLTVHCTSAIDGRIWLGYALSRNDEWVEDKGYVQTVEVKDFSGRTVGLDGRARWIPLPSHSGGEGHLFLNPEDYAGSHFVLARVVYKDSHKTVRSDEQSVLEECVRT